MAETEPNVWQKVANATNDVVTPANAIDVVAMGMAFHGAPRLNTWGGIVESGAAYMADVVDGRVARATGTTSDLGAKIDPIGDKIKIAYGLWHIWRGNLASRGLMTAVAAQNAANTAITVYDQVKNDEPQLKVSDDGKKAMFTQAWGIGLQVIGNKVGETHKPAGKALKAAGAIIGWAGFAYFGIPSTVQYLRKATGK